MTDNQCSETISFFDPTHETTSTLTCHLPLDHPGDHQAQHPLPLPSTNGHVLPPNDFTAYLKSSGCD